MSHTADLAIAVFCLANCGTVATGTTTEPPSNARFQNRWAELDAAGEKHTKATGHATAVRTRPAVTG